MASDGSIDPYGSMLGVQVEALYNSWWCWIETLSLSGAARRFEKGERCRFFDEDYETDGHAD